MRRLFRVCLAMLLASAVVAGLANTASAGWLQDLFQPVGYEELAPPAEPTLDAPPLDLQELEAEYWPSDSVLLNPPAGPAVIPGMAAEGFPLELGMPYAAGAPPWSAAPPMADWPMAAPPACCAPPTIHFWNHPLLASTVCRCGGDELVPLILSVPTQCCAAEVEVCIPACCSGAPGYEAERDWLGRITHTYGWPCGYELTIVQRHLGDWVVHTYNR